MSIFNITLIDSLIYSNSYYFMIINKYLFIVKNIIKCIGFILNTYYKHKT